MWLFWSIHSAASSHRAYLRVASRGRGCWVLARTAIPQNLLGRAVEASLERDERLVDPVLVRRDVVAVVLARRRCGGAERRPCECAARNRCGRGRGQEAAFAFRLRRVCSFAEHAPVSGDASCMGVK